MESVKVMSRFASFLAASLLASGLAAPAAASLGSEAACSEGRPAVLVSVAGFKARTGRIRVQLYGDNPGSFLASGGRLKRIDLPVPPAGAVNVCVAVPHPGTYAIAVRHDVNGDNAKGDWSDGGGFSNNPKLSLFHLKPSLQQVAFAVGGGVKPVVVTLLYRHRFSIGPAERD
ncbi:MAG: hypothetical protein QOH81_1807 [Sphingomonadales bacterium]|jgi:uncharacterized protein (DUF2141 family)|nr:hypothetical protein [Sphingomonadales bacterium]